jgi:ribonuclease E
MLIDAAHPEETRVVVLSGNRLDEFDFESSTKKQVKGNIYLAKVTRVEPSLQAAFVDYGGNRHGFLAFDEIHPDYYRIPVGDRPDEVPLRAVTMPAEATNGADPLDDASDVAQAEVDAELADAAEQAAQYAASEPEMAMAAPIEQVVAADALPREGAIAETQAESEAAESEAAEAAAAEAAVQSIETLGGGEVEEAIDEAETERPRHRPQRHYKIQEVVKRRQIMLVQVVKEERGNKGAALTTYLSLAGRYCVLMPNTGRGGGVSRKITSMIDRRRLKDILEDLEIPQGMGVIVRTAGSERSKAEVKRDYEYLLRLWTEIRELTLQSTAPALIYEEGNLIKRSIRDLYTRDIDEVQVEGEEGYRTAKGFMRMLMPSHAKRVQPYRDEQVGLFHKHQVESQIDAIHSPVAQLKSGGYVVINQTEALVAIDVNSGRSTRERNIEETALRTNLEAADEIARQLRLRDLAGLIVIDFIDMEEHRNHGAVERRLKDALKNDRARIQVGRISPFGLLEMSRQRLRPSLAEASTQPCPHCGGTGSIRSTESTALYVLRAIEEEAIRLRAAELCVFVPTAVALYLLNQKRDSLARIEQHYAIKILVDHDDSLIPPSFRIERLRARDANEIPVVRRSIQTPVIEDDDDSDDVVEDEAEETAAAQPEARRRGRDRGRGRERGPDRGPDRTPDRAPDRSHEHEREAGEASAQGEGGRGRRRRRRRRRPDENGEARPAAAAAEMESGAELSAEAAAPAPAPEAGEDGDSEHRRRRRGRRGGRWRSRREEGGEAAASAESGATDAAGDIVSEAVEEAPRYVAVATDADEPHPLTASEPEPAAPEPLIAAAPEPLIAAAPEPVIAAEPEPEPEPEPVPETPPAAEPEPALAAAPPPAPGVDLHAVGDEKPANPRRGWWNRLTE